MIHPAATKMSSASTVPEMFSTFPCPNGCSASATLFEVLTAKRAMTAAMRSTPEWIASEMTDTELARHQHRIGDDREPRHRVLALLCVHHTLRAQKQQSRGTVCPAGSNS